MEVILYTSVESMMRLVRPICLKVLRGGRESTEAGRSNPAPSWGETAY